MKRLKNVQLPLWMQKLFCRNRRKGKKSSLVDKPLKKGLEITPISTDNLNDIKRWNSQITINDGSSVRNVQIYGSYKDYVNSELSQAFYARGSMDHFEFKPLKSGDVGI